MSATALVALIGGMAVAPAAATADPATGAAAAPWAGSDDDHRVGPVRPFRFCQVMLPPDRPPVSVRSWTAIWSRPIGQLRWGDRLRAACAVTTGGHYSTWDCGRSNRWILVTLHERTGYVPLGCVRWFSPAWPPRPLG